VPALAATVIFTGSGPSLAAPEWRSILRVEAPDGHRPRALGFDETNAVYWLEARIEPDGRALGRIRSRAGDSDADPVLVADQLPLKSGRCALLAWRGRCFLAAPPTIRIIETGDGESATVSNLDPTFTIARGHREAGFGGLTIAPDGRIYGSFSGVTVQGIEATPGVQNAVFRFEPDATGFELVHRGLTQPSAPIFDDIGRSRLIDHVDGKPAGARIMRLLDGGFGATGKPFAVEGAILPELAASGQFKAADGWLFSLARTAKAGPVSLVWQPQSAAKTDAPAPDPGSLLEGAQIIDLASDWNGVPHLMVFRPGGSSAPGGIEVLAFREPGDPVPAEEKLAEIRSHFDIPAPKDGTGLLKFLSDPERRIRRHAAWALSRRPEGLTLLQHVLGKGEPLSLHAALAGVGVIARRGAGAAVPGDDIGFAALPKDDLARQAAEVIGAFVTHSRPEVRVQAMQALGSARRPAGLIPFEIMLADSEQSVRDETLLAAGRLRWRALVSSMKTARARGGGALDTGRLADALDGIHPPEQLAVYSRYGDKQLRLAAVEALRRHGHASLANFVFDSEPEVAAAAVVAIDQWRLRQAFATVATRLSQGSIDDWPLAARQAAERCALAAGK